jgi:hypothetical protein
LVLLGGDSAYRNELVLGIVPDFGSRYVTGMNVGRAMICHGPIVHVPNVIRMRDTVASFTGKERHFSFTIHVDEETGSHDELLK